MSEAPAPYAVNAPAPATRPAPPTHPPEAYRAVIALLVRRLRDRQALDRPRLDGYAPRIARLRAQEAVVIAQAHALDTPTTPMPLRGSYSASEAST